MVMDSLRHWVQSYHIDGFRFDLGTTLGREAGGFDPGAGFFDAIRQDPSLADVKLISEPWDIGPGGYQLGNHPPGFAEWNDRFRDSVRRFWRGDLGQRAEISARLLGSSDIFEKRRRKTWASVNFIAAHDGFTLHDTVTFGERHNEANGEDGRDGHSENHSTNWGQEGETEDAAINACRDRVKRAMLATMLFAHGTPMLLGGDEFCRTQKGNNNAYCQDNEISWFDWKAAIRGNVEETSQLADFIATLIALRKAHPSLCSENFLHGNHEIFPGVRDVVWLDETGNVLSLEAWSDAAAQLLTLQRTALVNENLADVTLLMLNASNMDREFLYPQSDLKWDLKLNSAGPELQVAMAGPGIVVSAHSVALLAAAVRL
jgi:glycogen operon protein